MTESDLIHYGWVYDAGAHVYQWRDPLSIASWYTLHSAILIQQERLSLTDAVPNGGEKLEQ